ncbi:MAG: hypothetical protein DRJ35_03835 [Thermoprotei archaeon]|nr:MAG: hypothetical protein DRJ35_03835 [Thermoprotei archaeon]
MKTKTAYIDTNIFVYAILHHPVFGNEAERIVRDAVRGRFEAYGSLLVAIELLGALSKINVNKASIATEAYLQLDVRLLGIDHLTVKVATIINRLTGIKYDSVHAALMFLNNIDTIITNDEKDWKQVTSKAREILDELKVYGVEPEISKIHVVTTNTYKKWVENMA